MHSIIWLSLLMVPRYNIKKNPAYKEAFASNVDTMISDD
jgi:hypothetical protein